ncbi:hypothetical protein ILUMI_18683 [Ignelater luminosus]|uniref:Galectin n=1 Tax=Ignelater luminosus TaxID=2038154 RepID=A0A8K0G0N0_IGNLU|nr:hypothetical protein ILUMI_18683 [Ignelater luminosus]
MESVINPQIPYVGPIQQNFAPGRWIKICGTTPAAALRFTVSLRCTAEDDIALQMSVNIIDNNISINSMRRGVWDETQTILGCPIKNQDRFEIILTCDFTQYKILINGEAYSEFPQRIAYDRVNRIAIEDDVSIELIAQEVERPTIGFKQAEAEAPPPSYNELQSKVYAPNATNYGSCSLPTTAPYPTNPTFVAAIPAYQPYPIQPAIYPTQSSTMVPLNAASSNFRPVSNNFI